jgi:3-oxoacyl-[acyl-carrier-protein] synthase III
MAFIDIKDYRIKGVSAAVPQKVIDNVTLDILGNEEEKQKFLNATHIKKRHVVGETGVTTSDLCQSAAERLLETSGIEPSQISVLIFVTQTPDYQLPSTAIILQDKLGLSKDCIAIQVSLGCSGWVLGLSTALTYLNSMKATYGLVLVGDTVTMTKSPLDKSTFPLFGDAGTATLLEREEGATGFKFHIGNDGSGYQTIIIEDGGYRNPVSLESFKMKERDNGGIRNNLQSYLNGDAVFIFGITKAPSSIKSLMQQYSLNEAEIDYLLLHQANKMMNDKIAKKAGFNAEKVPFSLQEFGNTSSASIPLTMVTQIPKLTNGICKNIACGFGVGLSWASVYFETKDLIVPELIILN